MERIDERLRSSPGAPGLVAALAVGLVIGLERGWHDRELPEGDADKNLDYQEV
ncbi:hypothetical protein CTATCC11996_08780, partial [Comamonas testosteroni ATCC 11996]